MGVDSASTQAPFRRVTSTTHQLPRDHHQVGEQGGRGWDLLQVGRGGGGGGPEDVGRRQGGWGRALHHQVGQPLLCGINKEEEEEVYFDDEDKEV